MKYFLLPLKLPTYRILLLSPALNVKKSLFINLPTSSHLYSTYCNISNKKIRQVNSANVSDLLCEPRLSSLIKVRHFRTDSFKNKEKKGKKDAKEKKNKEEEEEQQKVSQVMTKMVTWVFTTYIALMIIASIILPNSEKMEMIQYVSWNEFVYHMLAKGEVEEIIARPDVDMVTIVLYDGAIIKGKRAEKKVYHMHVDVSKFEEKLRQAEAKLGIKPGNGATVVYERGEDTASKILSAIIVGVILLSLLSRGKGIKTPNIMDAFSHLTRAKFTLVDPVAGQGKGVRFSDVAGLKEAKQEVMEFVDYLKRPEHYSSLGAKVPKGALLLGPPGCGKTLLAKAVATEANVPFLSMNGSEFIEMIGGLGAARVRDLFKEARKRSPCIIYIDEIDAIGRKRMGSHVDGSGGESEQTLNQLLVEMDGMASKEGVLMLASTNRADVLDKALLRPGRFDRHILIDLPTLQERQEMFEYHLKSITLEKSPAYYSKRLAYLTPGFSGADIANVCNEAALHAARNLQKCVTSSDLEYAVERLVGGTEKRSQVISPEEKEIVAYHESGHALIGWLLPRTNALLKVTIVPRTTMALGFTQNMQSDQKLYSKEDLFETMCMMLGGRVAEAIVFNRVTTGAKNDLEKVTKLANSQIRQHGMSEVVGLVSFPDHDKSSVRPYSKGLHALMEQEARRLIARAYKHTEDVLVSNKDKLKLLAEELLQRETLRYDDVEKLIGPPPHGKKSLVQLIDFENSVSENNESPPPEQEPASNQMTK